MDFGKSTSILGKTERKRVRLKDTRQQDNIIDTPTGSEAKTFMDVALAAAKQGGDVLLKYLNDGVPMRQKASGDKSYDLVSDADEQSEHVIATVIRDHFPTHELLGEEALAGGDVDADDLWIIDPLDGTNNFAHSIPHFAVSIAYHRRGTPVAGVILNPATGDLFTAAKGLGATHDGSPCKVDTAGRLDEVLIGCGFYYDRGEMMRKTLGAIDDFFSEHIHGIRRFGTASLDLCNVGIGRFGGFFEYKLSPWDFAAGRLIVEEAGGTVTTAKGQAVRLRPTSILASNGRLHDAMLAITTKHHPSDVPMG